MERKLFTLLMILFIAKINYAQSNFPIIHAKSIIVNVKEDGKLTKNAWLISPEAKPDIYKTSGKTVTFYTDMDSITFTVDPAVGEYNFIILLNGKDSALTQIKYVASYVQPRASTAEETKKLIEGQIYSLKVAPEPVYKIENRSVWNGTDSIKVRIYYPNNKKNQRIIFNIHGGAFIAGDLDTHDNICRILANKTQSIVIALDYRKPPANPFPASINDCSTVLRWIKTNAKTFGGDAGNIVLIGDSAGGLFTVALAIKLQNKLNVKLIVLVNPAVDLRNYERSPSALITGWYMGDQSADDSLASPITAKDFSFFPPTLIITSEKDPLKNQGVEFYNKLLSQNIKVKIIDIPNQGHLAGYWSAGHSKADVAIVETVNFILTGFSK